MQIPVAIPDDVAEPLTGESKTKILTREQARDMVRENFDWWYVEHAILKFNDIEFDDDTDIYGCFTTQFGWNDENTILESVYHETEKYSLDGDDNIKDQIPDWFRNTEIGIIVHLPEFALFLVREKFIPGEKFVEYCKRRNFYDFVSESIKTPSMPKEFFLRVGYLREEKASQNSNLPPTERKTARKSMKKFNEQLQAIGASPFDTDGEINISNPSPESTTSSVDEKPISSIGAEKRCKEWLTSIMKNEKGEMTKPDKNKYLYQIEAMGKFLNLTKRAFGRAWDKAIEETGNTNFSKPGRKS